MDGFAVAQHGHDRMAAAPMVEDVDPADIDKTDQVTGAGASEARLREAHKVRHPARRGWMLASAVLPARTRGAQGVRP
jgi:hypothetical protein